MPYFVGQTELAGTSKVLDYYFDGLDARTEPREQSSYYQQLDYFADPERSQDPSLAEKLAPKYVRVSKQVKSLPDYILNGGNGYAHLPISDRVRRVIERFEPGRHYFSPLTVLKHDLTKWPEPYWLFKAAPSAVAQAMIVEQSPSLAWKPINLLHLSYSKWMSCVTRGGDLSPISQRSTDSAGGFVLDQSVFDDRHIVLEDVLRCQRIFFLSDPLVAALKAEKVRGFKLVKVGAEPRQVPPYGPSDGTGAVT